MTRTEWGALVVLVAAAAAGGLRLAQPDTGQPDAGAVPPPAVAGRAPAAASVPDPPAGDGATGAAVGGGERGGAGAAEPGSRVASPGNGRAIGLRPAPREAAERAAITAGDPSAETAREIPVEASSGVAREVTPPAARPERAAGAVEDAAADDAAVTEAGATPGGGADVLLSIPLRGAVEPEDGSGSPPQTSGLVSYGGTIEFTEDAQYTLPAGGHVNSAAGTISFTIDPNWAGSDESNNSLLQIRDEHRWENSLGIVKNYNALRYIIHDQQGVETNVNVYIDQWQPNQPHTVTATWDNERMTLSVDGAQVGESPLPNPVQFGDATPIHVGSDFPGSTYRGANGRISDLTVRSTALTPAGVP